MTFYYRGLLVYIELIFPLAWLVWSVLSLEIQLWGVPTWTIIQEPVAWQMANSNNLTPKYNLAVGQFTGAKKTGFLLPPVLLDFKLSSGFKTVHFRMVI